MHRNFDKKGRAVIRGAAFIAIALAALVILALLGVYFGGSVYKIFTYRGLRPHKLVFWVILSLAVAAAIYTRSMFLATLMYGTMLFAIGDVLRFAVKMSRWQSGSRALDAALQGGLTLIIIAVIITFAAWHNARNPVLTSYTVELDKDFGTLEGLEIVMLSDLHLGTATNESSLDALVQNINAQKPDVVALIGDIFDEGTPDALRGYAIAALGNLTARYGVYYVTGNHDAAVSQEDAAAWEKSGVKPLLDEVVLIENSFYLIGLRDPGHRSDSQRGDLSAMLENIDRTKPVILLDHRPGALETALEAGVDLQLSGHTHAGQLFPFGRLAARVNKVGYGHEQFGRFNIIVSSGYSVWGMPVRLGSRCEYVQVSLVGN